MSAQGGNTPAEIQAQEDLQKLLGAQYTNFAGYFIKGNFQKVDARYANDDDVVALYTGPKPGSIGHLTVCYGKPTEMLDLARARLTPEQWKQFESDFQHHCDYSGLNVFNPNIPDGKVAWAKWSYMCGKGL